MNSGTASRIFTISLTIFAMLFGAGNLMYPIQVGIQSGTHPFLGFLGFAVTGILLPVLALVAIVAFEGDYNKFFGRLGNGVGSFFIFLCMLIIGPFLVMPRIITFSYSMMRPFLPVVAYNNFDFSLIIFSFLFVVIAFVATYRPGKLFDIIGKFLSPLKFLTLAAIVCTGILSGFSPLPVDRSLSYIFFNAFSIGYGTLDVLGTIFFGSIIVTMLTRFASGDEKLSIKEAMHMTTLAGIFAGILLGSIYLGMTFLAAFHGHGLGHLNPGDIFSEISFRILGHCGAALLGVTILIACFTTTVALTAVVGNYIHNACKKSLSYVQSIILVLGLCVVLASCGLDKILYYSGPFITYLYPLLIVITFCNLAYKLIGFNFIKLPVALTALVTLPSFLAQLRNFWQ